MLLHQLRLLTSGLCAQLPSHSFHPAGIQLPLCARDTGLFLAFFVTLLFRSFLRPERCTGWPRPPWLALLGAALLALLADSLNSFLAGLGAPHLYQPANTVRLASGLIGGQAAAELAAPVLNLWLFGARDPRPTIEAATDLLLPLAASAAVFLALVVQAGAALYPLAALSALAAVALVSLVNLMLLVSLSGRTPARLLGMLAVALAATEMAGLAYLRGLLLPLET